MKKILFILFFMSAVSLAQHRWINESDDEHGHMPPHHDPMAMMERLKLTGDQQKQMGKLHDDMQKNQIAFRAKIQSLQIDVRSLFREDNPEQAKIEAEIQEISKTQTEMKLNHLGFWFKVNAILTPDQQKIWKEHPMMEGRNRMDGFPSMKTKKKRVRIIKDRDDDE